jgi:hypothetical protein
MLEMHPRIRRMCNRPESLQEGPPILCIDGVHRVSSWNTTYAYMCVILLLMFYCPSRVALCVTKVDTGLRNTLRTVYIRTAKLTYVLPNSKWPFLLSSASLHSHGAGHTEDANRTAIW